jgi:hypothetical protein
MIGLDIYRLRIGNHNTARRSKVKYPYYQRFSPNFTESYQFPTYDYVKVGIHLNTNTIFGTERSFFPAGISLLYVYTKYFCKIGENPLEYSDNEKALGVIVNSTLNFTDHCESLQTKAN